MKKDLVWVLFAVLALACGFCAVAFVVGVVAAFGPHKGTTRADLLVGDAVFALFAFVLGWLARSVEHHARTNEGFRTAISKGLAVRAPHSAPRNVLHSRRSEMFWLGLVVIGFLIGGIVGTSDWQRSQETQDNGLRATGVVTQVVAVSHSTRYSSYDTYNLDVTLTPPVRGRQRTVVNTSYQSAPAYVGETVHILVDPNDLGYAELPGAPTSTITDCVLPFVFLLGLAGLMVWNGYRHRRRARRSTQPEPAMVRP